MPFDVFIIPSELSQVLLFAHGGSLEQNLYNTARTAPW